MWMLFFLSALLGALGSPLDTASGAAQQLQTLHCPPCEQIHCSTQRALKLQCKGGVTTGVCGCCPVCARAEGETCGGTWDYLGKCDEGLVCVYQDSADKPDAERKGICKAVIESSDQESCRPECTREYCQANPSEICSARFVSLEKTECQGSCQHTSCSSCLLLKPPSCPQTCSPSDHSCLHHFGKCVHNHLIATHNAVCHNNLQANPEGHFLCLVPACPNTTT
ncbi:hypothetical protein ABVT39_005431 [Epinephelus coioides]|uniref:IGFBP domain-containing protein n=1 Tax=Epinephelus moara TaxID=300413 RepID=UPI00214E7AC2|nr:IGFBP domain-containing protein [Epinephelus moara]